VLEIRVLGEFRLIEDGTLLRFRAPDKALELLAYLLVHPGPVERGRIAEVLWPDKDVEEGRTELRRHLYYLATRALPEGVTWITGDKRTISWNPDAPAIVDRAQFQSLAPVDPIAALGQYQGDLFPGLDTEWIIADREHDRLLAADLCATAIERAMSTGKYDEAILFATQLTAIDPWNEAAVRSVIAARSASGDTTGAAHAYNDFSRRLADELGVEPAPETRAAYEAAVHVPRTTRVVGTRLTSFVGREADIQDLAALLDRAAIVTLTGPGGVGKTRLVQELFRTTFAQSSLKLAFVKLAAIGNPTFVLSTIAAALGVREEHDASLIDTIAGALERTDVLLAVDNCEHMLEETASALEALAVRLPRLRVIATSREPLRIDGEQVFRVNPLGAEAAATLFCDRARAAGAVDALAPAAATSIAAICRKLDGLPLAIELAAAQAYDKKIVAIAKSLDEDFSEATARRTADPRQRSLRALLDWSVDRLDPHERDAFAALGVLIGTFSERTAAAVCGTGPPLETLVAKSLVVRENDTYSLLETTRRHAVARLEEERDAGAVRLRHARHALALAHEAQIAFRTGQRPAWREPFMAEMDNIRGALDWALAHRKSRLLGIALAAELDVLWWDASLAVEGARWIERALELLPPEAPAALRARCWLAAAWLRSEGPARIEAAAKTLGLIEDLASDAERARACCAFAQSAQYIEGQRGAMSRALDAARAYAERSGDAYSLALAMHLTGDVLVRAHRDAEAHAIYDDAVKRYRALGDERGTAMVLANIAEGAFRRGELGEALRYSSEALAIMRARNERHFALLLLANVAMYGVAAGDAVRARTHCDEGYAIAREAALPMETAIFVAIYAMLAAAERDYPRAAQLLGCTDRMYREGMFLRDHTENVLVETLEERLRSELSPEEFARNRRIGEASDPADLVIVHHAQPGVAAATIGVPPIVQRRRPA